MTRLKRAALTAFMVVAFAAIAGADQWNDRTTLKFDAPMMVPGATLAPGTYVFKLMDSPANRQTVQIFNEDESKLMATTQAIPTKRQDARGDVVIKVNPTESGSGAPAALKAWFYPGSIYGHEFVYSDAQARDISARTKTVVLSEDVSGSDAGKGTVYTYDAQGRKTAFQPDWQTMKEWNDWKRNRRASATVHAPGTAETRESTAPMMRTEPEGMRVSIGDIEEHPDRYLGKQIHVTAEVEDVFGPRLFKIDEPNWADLDGEVLVYLPSDLAALVRPGDRVTVTGTMKKFVEADIHKDLGWLEPEPDIEVKFIKRPMLAATQVVGGNNDVALAINVRPGAIGGNQPVGTSGASTSSETDATSSSSSSSASYSAAAKMTDAAALATGTDNLVGRKVNLSGVKVRSTTRNGFWIDAGGHSVFVLPSAEAGQKVSTGQSVSVEGLVLEMPRSLRDKTHAAKSGNEEIYVYATTVK